MSNQGKKGFNFRMSKKVAELTQVVHMLFTRNHEKEVEMEALKDAYEYEIDLVIKDAKTRIEKLEKQLAGLQNVEKGKSDKLSQQLQETITKQEQEYKLKIDHLIKQLNEERKECQNARDLLISAQQDIEQLKSAQNSELAKQAAEVSVKNEEISLLKTRINQLERQLKDKGDSSLETVNSLQVANNKLNLDISQLKQAMEGLNRAKEQLSNKNRQMELEMKQLKRELTKQVSDRQNLNSRQYYENTGYLDMNDELEKLRKEVQRYRLELYNREGNFNRIFSDKQPVVLPGNKRRVSFSSGSVQQSGGLLDRSLTRERTLPAFSGNYTLEEDRESMNISRNGQRPETGKLPQLGSDTRNKIHRLIKPKPLPREVISEKPHRATLI